MRRPMPQPNKPSKLPAITKEQMMKQYEIGDIITYKNDTDDDWKGETITVEVFLDKTFIGRDTDGEQREFLNFLDYTIVQKKGFEQMKLF